MTWLHLATIVASSCGAALVALWALRSVLSRNSTKPFGIFSETSGACVFLFDRTELVDASESGRALLSRSPVGGDPWARLMAYAAPRFPGLEEKLARLPDYGRLTLAGATRNPLSLRAEWLGGLTRIVLSEPDSQGAEGLNQHALEEELASLRATLDRAPFPAWREDADGTITWANRGYLDLVAAQRPGAEVQAWPLPGLFPKLIGATSTPECQRCALTLPDRPEPRWFDIQGFPLGGDRVYFALPADTTVHAEQALRSFMQTLTKTFGHLTIGLAIFDRKRRLALFNPALIDLTGLPADFLSGRPTLLAMLDAMREHQMLPEPRDYKTWRAEIAALEKAAASGEYAETWTLPNGQTYRVNGRPHPDGALAFVIEDISAETALARRFRGDLQLSHAVFDSLEEAIAVFAPTGLLLFSNTAYDQLWHDASGLPRDASIAEAVNSWQRLSALSPVWSEAQTFVLETGARQPWQGEARLNDGRLLSCRFAALPGGASLIGFKPAPSRRPGVVQGSRQSA